MVYRYIIRAIPENKAAKSKQFEVVWNRLSVIPQIIVLSIQVILLMQFATQYRFKLIRSWSTFRFLMVVAVGLLSHGTLSCRTLSAQVTSQDTPAQTASVEELRQAYEASVDKLRASVKGLRRSEALFLFSDSEASHDHKEQWDSLAVESELQFEAIRGHAYALFLALEKPDEDLQLVVRNLATGSILQGQIEQGHRICQRLADLNPDNEELAEELIRVDIFKNKFDDAAEFAKLNIDKIKDYNKKEQAILGHIDELKTNFQRELKFREKDKTANLPRVEMKIKGKGKVILELFEDQAPETVANFISLTEAGFYDGIIFHHAVNSYLVHGGFMSMNHLKSPEYTIYDESDSPDRRHHFRGTISMWSNGQPDNGGAEFSILRMPEPFFSKARYTAFGRVIEGMDVIDSIQNTRTLNEEDGSETVIKDIIPDTIETMRVVRKRDHAYEPNIVEK